MIIKSYFPSNSSIFFLRNVRLAEAPSYGMPINLYDSRSSGAESYRLLAAEVISRGEEI